MNQEFRPIRISMLGGLSPSQSNCLKMSSLCMCLNVSGTEVASSILAIVAFHSLVHQNLQMPRVSTSHLDTSYASYSPWKPGYSLWHPVTFQMQLPLTPCIFILNYLPERFYILIGSRAAHCSFRKPH